MITLPKTHAFGFALAAAALCGCSGSPEERSDQQSSAIAAPPLPSLMWYATLDGNPQEGTLSAWLLNGERVTGTENLNQPCGSSDSCDIQWRVVDTGLSEWNGLLDHLEYHSILWFNGGQGTLQSWVFDHNGTVSTPDPPISCASVAGGCAGRPIGRMVMKPANAGPCSQGGSCPAQVGLLWNDPIQGLRVWVLSGSTVVSTEALGMAPSSPMIVDLDGDGYDDLLFYDASAGGLSAWLLDGTNVKSTQQIDWMCGSGCSDAWTLIGHADLNWDNHEDLTWWNSSTGEVSSWLLDGTGHVKGTYKDDWVCGAGCSNVWQPLGYVRFPPPVQ
jgi:hypothetical protein